MEPQSKRLEYKVGLFIGIGLIAAMLSILLLGGDKALFTSYDTIRTRFAEVQGLFPGSVVSLAGVQVGNIDHIEFVPQEDKLEVVMRIERKFANRLVEGTIAEIRTQGALGDKYIYLKPGPQGSKPLPKNTILESDETDFMKLLTSREDGAARAIDLIKELHILVASINQQGRAGETAKNLAEAAITFKSTLKQLDVLLASLNANIPPDKKLGKSLISLANILEKVDQGKGSLGLLINDPSLHQSLKVFLGGSPRNRYMKDMIRETIQRSETAP